MKADVTFHVEYDENKNHLRISCGNVDGDGLPMPLYMMMLTSLVELQYKINGEKTANIDQPLSVEERSRKWYEENLPPPPAENSSGVAKRPKPYTVEEKTEIAMMYESGMNVMAIAEKFGREPSAIRILMSKMGVKRGNEPTSQESVAEKKESALKKPWYLKG